MTCPPLLRRTIAALVLATPLLAAAQDLPPGGPGGGPPETPPGTPVDNPLPEPGSLALVGLAIAGIVAARRRK